jgi:hypothetical protein
MPFDVAGGEFLVLARVSRLWNVPQRAPKVFGTREVIGTDTTASLVFLATSGESRNSGKIGKLAKCVARSGIVA